MAPRLDMVKLTKSMLHGGQWEEYVALAPLFNVDKIIVENDAEITLFPSIDFSSNFRDFARNSDAINLEKTFNNQVEIYDIPAAAAYEKIYVPEKIVQFNGSFERLPDLSHFIQADKKTAFLLNDYNEDLERDISEYSNAELIALPGVYDVEDLSSVTIDDVDNGDYQIWYATNDYQLYDVEVRSIANDLELVISQPERSFEVNGKTLTIPRQEESIPLLISEAIYSKFFLMINGNMIGEVNLDELTWTDSQSFGGYPFKPNSNAQVRIYGLKREGQPDILSIEDPSFENGVWSEVRVVGESKGHADIQVATQITDGTEGQSALNLESQNRDAAVYQNIFGYFPDALYNFKFDYRINEGASPYINLVEQGVEVYNTIDLKSGQVGEWQSFEKMLTPNKDATGLALYVYAKADQDAQISSVSYDNFVVEKIPLLQEFTGRFFGNQSTQLNQAGSITVSQGQIDFSSGGSLIDVTDEMLNNASFEEGGWSEPADSKADLPGTPTIISNLSGDAYEGDSALFLSTDMHKINVHHKLENLNPNVRYIVNLATKKVRGENPSYLIHQKGINIYGPKGTLYEAEGQEGEWNNHRFSFDPNQQTTGATLYLYAGDGKEVLTEVLYDAFKIYQVNNLDSYMALRDSSESYEPVQVEFERHTPSHYTGQMSQSNDDFVFIFGESFHPRWQLTLSEKGGGQSIVLDQDSHFIANGYANAWSIPAGEWDFELRFGAERIYRRSVIASLLASIVFFTVIGLRLIKTKPKLRMEEWIGHIT